MKKLPDKIACLNLNITDDSDFLSPYSPSETPLVSSEVADFLENSARAFHPRAKVDLTITGRCIDESEKSVYGDAIRNYFSLKLAETERDIKRKGFVSLIFAIIGVVALVFMIIYESFVNNAVWTECVDIFAWVFLWEAVDQFFIERSGLLLKRKRFENFVNMSIEFK